MFKHVSTNTTNHSCHFMKRWWQTSRKKKKESWLPRGKSSRWKLEQTRKEKKMRCLDKNVEWFADWKIWHPLPFIIANEPSERRRSDGKVARWQQNRAAQDSAVGRKILDRASKSVTSCTSCNVDSAETKWCDSFSQSKGGKLYLAHMCSFLGGTRRLNLNVVRFYCLFT